MVEIEWTSAPSLSSTTRSLGIVTQLDARNGKKEAFSETGDRNSAVQKRTCNASFQSRVARMVFLRDAAKRWGSAVRRPKGKREAIATTAMTERTPPIL